MSITPTALTGLLVADTYTAPNGSPDSIASPTEVNGQPVDAVLELQSTTRGLLVPRMTTIQRNTMIVTDGFVIYNLDTNKFNFYSNGVWGSVGGGSVIGPGVSIAGDIAIFADNTGTVLADSGVPITQVPAPLTHLLRDSFLSTVNQIGNLGHVQFVNGLGLVFVDSLMPVEFIENNFGAGSQVCSLFTGELPGSSTTPSCLVELQSTTGALVISRMTTTQRLALFATNGMIVYDTTANIFYVYQGGIWNAVDTSGGSVTQLNQGTGITCSPNPIVGAGTISLTNTAVTAGSYTVMNGTVNAQGQLTAASSATVITDTTGTTQNLFIGIGSGVLGTTSIANCAVGGNTLFSNNQNFPSSSFNCAFGYTSLSSNTSGSSNSGFGYLTLGSNTSGSDNCAFGDAAMRFNATGSKNCAVGSLALASASAGSNASSGSCAFGYQALYNNSSGGICAFGYQALYSNVSAIGNSAFGYQALTANTSGASNNAFGSSALVANTVGANNNAFGPSSLLSNIGGSGNCAFGFSTLSANINGNNNSAVGYNSGVSQASYTNCSFFGSASDASISGLTNSTAIGAGSSVATSNSLVLGSSCNVGINQPSPAYTLHVSNVSSNCSIKLDNTTSTPSSPASGGILYTSGNSLFYANTSATINLTSSGVTPGSYTVMNGTVNGAGQLTAASSATRIIDSGTNTFVGFTCGNNTLTGNNNLAVGKLTLQALTNGSQNTVFGQAAGNSITIGLNNSAFGFNALDANISGNYNSAFGASTLINNTGSNNTAIGQASGSIQSTYTSCTFLGYNADASNNSLTNATAIGAGSSVSTSNSLVLGNSCNVGINQSSPSYTFHISNVSSLCSIKLDNTSSTPSAPSAAQGGVIYISSDNLFYKNSSNTIQLNANYIHDDESNYNLFVGLSAGKLPTTTSVGCTAVGVSCLHSLTSGNDDCAYGEFSLSAVTSGSQNSGYGSYSLFLNTNGSNNTAIGYFSLGNMNSVSVNSNNTAVGYQSGNLRSGYSNCTFIGTLADASSTGLSNAAAIGANATVGSSNSLILGNGCNVGIGMSSPTTRLCITGADQSFPLGPHILCQTSLDAYPQFQLLNYSHNNVSLNFDAYWNGSSWISCTNSSNFQINKDNQKLNFNYANGFTQGSTITWSSGIILKNSGEVGIGDSSPVSKLSVVGNAQIGFTSGTAGPTNGLAVSGNVGIGTTTANSPLQFANNVINRILTLYQALGNDQNQFYGFGIASGILRYQIDSTSGNHVFYAATSSSASNELVRITGTGKLGIGITPTSTLHVNGTIITAPPASGATTVALGTAYQNTLGYDVLIVVYINVTLSAGGSIISGVGSTNTPTQQTVFSGITGTPSVSAIVPNNYYLKISTSGTITAAIVGQQETPL